MGILTTIKEKGLTKLMKADAAFAPYKNDVCFWGGLVVLGFGIVKLCVASSKLPEKADNLQQEINAIAQQSTNEEHPISEDQANAMTRRARGEAAWSIFREFAPGAIAVVVGTGAVCASRMDLKDSYLKTTAALVGVQETFAQYRDRVRAEEGAAMDTHYMYGTKRMNVPTVIGTDENGVPIAIAETPTDNVLTDIPKDLSIIEIPCTNVYYKDDPGYMLTFIKNRFGEAQRLYRLRGCVTRNDICDLFAVARDYSDEGMRAGYPWDQKWIDSHGGDSPIQYQVHFVTKENYTKYIPNGQPFEKSIIIELQNLGDVKAVSRFRRLAS